MKICIVTSAGGHLWQAYLLKPWWNKYECSWVTIKAPDSLHLLKKERVAFAFGPENRNVVNAVKNFFLALAVLSKEKPDLVFSTGSALAPPFFLVAKFMSIKTIYLEPFDFISQPSLTARLVQPLADILLVQHKSLKKRMSKAEYWGAVV